MRRGGGPTAAAVWWGTAGCAAVCAYAAVGYFHILVWNPQAAVPGTSLNGIHRRLDDAGASLSEPLVIAWAAFGGLAAAAVLVVSLLGRLPSVRVAGNWHLGLLALAAPALYIASSGANAALRTTFAVRGSSPWGAVLYGVSAAAGLALLVVPVRDALRRRREAAVPLGSPGHYDDEFTGFSADGLLQREALPVPAASPVAAAGGGAVPGIAAPDSAAPGSAAAPGGAEPGGAVPGIAAPGGAALDSAPGTPAWAISHPQPIRPPVRAYRATPRAAPAAAPAAAPGTMPGSATAPDPSTDNGPGADHPAIEQDRAAPDIPPDTPPNTPPATAPGTHTPPATAPGTHAPLPDLVAGSPPLSVPLLEEEAAMSQFIPTPPPINIPAPGPFAAPGQRAATPAAPQPSFRDTLRTLRSAPAGDRQKPRQVSLLRDDPAKADVVSLLAQNRDLLYPGLGAGAVGLTPPYLKDPSVTFWTVRENGTLLGCGAMKEFRPEPGNGITELCGEITSMRTSPHARGLGVGQIILQQIITDAHTRGYASLLLETGTQDFFASSRRLYQRHGFVPCPPFGKYRADPGSIFMRLDMLPAPAPTEDTGTASAEGAAPAGAAGATGATGSAPAAPVHAKAGTLSAILAAQRAIAAKPRQR